ncbi:phage minor tail protein [Escherichia coli]|uniref:Phage minor tail protein n=1 Tax=Escherichia coli TaxID=562 RepID=A0A377ECF1_ECOLX|nr:phage minor tail protein [Escherichia coli]
MAIKGLEQAIDNLSRVRKNAIPAASAMTINRVATTAINQSSSQVARETRVSRKTGKGTVQTETGHGQKSECQNYR